ncbi:AAA family ATPase [Streptococcus suis]|nr:AAA family ATPase [Streptococcus suis]
MIDKLANISKKSFHNFSFHENLRECNIFFGTNGSGKSSLSNWISENHESVKRFDTDYILDNIYTVDSLSGIKLLVGANRIGIEEAIENIKNANLNLVQYNQYIDKRIEDYKNEVFEFMTYNLSEARELFKMTRQINQKRNAKINPIDALKAWENDIIDADFSKINSSDSIELELTNLRKEKSEITFDTNRKIDIILTEIQNIFTQKIIKPDFQITKDLSEWLKEGLHLHNDGINECKFCGNHFDYEKVHDGILEKIQSQYSQAVESLERNKILLEGIKNDLFSQPEHIIDDSFKILNSNISEIINNIEAKIENPSLVIPYTFEIEANYNNVIGNIKAKIENLDKDILRQEALLGEIENVAKSWVAQKILERYPIDEVSEQLQQYEEQQRANERYIEENKQWIQEVEPAGNLRPFADLLNHEFRVIGINIKCQIDGNHYLLKHGTNPSITISTRDLSEGERRLIGFLHFYYDLYLEPEKSLKNNVECIIFDDPITSLDSDNRYFMTELINTIIKKLTSMNAQVFILTHSSIDFHNFGYDFDNNSLLKALIYKDEHGNSNIRKVESYESKNFSDYYRANFKTIYDFAKISNSKLSTVENCVRFANMGRLILESHARSNYRLENATSSAITQLMKFYNISEDKEEEFKGMLDVINSLSHGLSFYDIDINQISPREIRDAIRKLISIMFNYDKNHVIAMIGLADDSRALREIESW